MEFKKYNTKQKNSVFKYTNNIYGLGTKVIGRVWEEER